MSITVLHMQPMNELTEMAMLRRLRAGENSAKVMEVALREQARRPSLDLSVEELEALSGDAAARARYFRNLRLAQVSAARVLYLLDGYVAVARVEGDLDDAFRLTNSIEEPWSEVQSPEVACLTPHPCASSSVGDLFQDDATGEIFVCASQGFESLGMLAAPTGDALRRAA